MFLTHENDPAWRSRERPVGYYVSTAIIPGNYLSEGGYIVGVAISQHIPSVELHVHFRDALAFQVIDCMDADSVRGDYGGTLPGVIRPRLKWETQFTPRP